MDLCLAESQTTMEAAKLALENLVVFQRACIRSDIKNEKNKI